MKRFTIPAFLLLVVSITLARASKGLEAPNHNAPSQARPRGLSKREPSGPPPDWSKHSKSFPQPQGPRFNQLDAPDQQRPLEKPSLLGESFGPSLGRNVGPGPGPGRGSGPWAGRNSGPGRSFGLPPGRGSGPPLGQNSPWS